MTQLALFQDLDFVKNALEDAVSGMDRPRREQFLKMSKSGTWTYGREEIEVDPASEWVIAPQSLVTGFIAWLGGKPASEEMRSIFSKDKVLESDLPDVGATWQKQVGFTLACISGPDKGVQVRYTQTSKGGVGAWTDVVNAIKAKFATSPNEITPRVRLRTDKYKHAEYGTIVNPKFEIIGWEGLRELAAPTDAEPEVEAPSEEPVRARRRGAM